MKSGVAGAKALAVPRERDGPPFRVTALAASMGYQYPLASLNYHLGTLLGGFSPIIA